MKRQLVLNLLNKKNKMVSKDAETEYRTVKEYVTDILANDERARNDDTWLTWRVLRDMGFNIFIPFEEFKDMPSLETITRTRRKLQQEGFFLADGETRGHRAEREKFFHYGLGGVDDAGQRRFTK